MHKFVPFNILCLPLNIWSLLSQWTALFFFLLCERETIMIMMNVNNKSKSSDQHVTTVLLL